MYATIDFATADDLEPMAEPLADKDNAPALAFHERLGFEYSAMRVLKKRFIALYRGKQP